MAFPAIVGTLLIPILMQILKRVTPALQKEFQEFIQGWSERCFQTPNKWDDVAAKLVAAVLSVDLSGVTVKPTNNEATNTIVEVLIEVTTGAPPGWSANRPFDPSLDIGG